MGYLDGLTDAFFKRNADGESLFYPNGVLGKGYVLPDEAKRDEVRRFVRHYYIVTFGSMIVIGAFAEPIYYFPLFPFFLVGYYWKITQLVSGLPKTSERLSVKETYANSARSHNRVTLWLMLVASALFTCVGLATLLWGTTKWLQSLACAVFFGFGTLVLSYMVSVKAE